MRRDLHRSKDENLSLNYILKILAEEHIPEIEREYLARIKRIKTKAQGYYDLNQKYRHMIADLQHNLSALLALDDGYRHHHRRRAALNDDDLVCDGPGEALMPRNTSPPPLLERKRRDLVRRRATASIQQVEIPQMPAPFQDGEGEEELMSIREVNKLLRK